MTLNEALAVAVEHWSDRHGTSGAKGTSAMATFAGRCVELLGGERPVSSLGVSDGVRLLAQLRAEGLAPKSVAAYYGGFRRMLTLNGVDTVRWPSAPTPPRKTREAILEDDLDRLIDWLDRKGRYATSDLARLLRGTGVRIAIEGLSECALAYGPPSGDVPYGVLTITGKGGHQRMVPVVDKGAMAVLASPERLAAIRALSYRGHLRWWTAGVEALGISTKLPTPHSVRHLYACDALRKSGGNLVMVQELLGHSDPGVTARYLAANMVEKAKALGGGVT